MQPQPGKRQRRDREAGRVNPERWRNAPRCYQRARQRRQGDLGDDGRRPQAAVGRHQLLFVHDAWQDRGGGRVEHHPASCQPERHRVHGGQFMVDQRQHSSQEHSPQVRGDHQAQRRQPIDQHASHRGQQQHRGDLGDHHACHTQSRAGQAEHQHHQRHRAERVTPTRHRLRHEQPTVPAGPKNRSQPWPPAAAPHPRIMLHANRTGASAFSHPPPARPTGDGSPGYWLRVDALAAGSLTQSRCGEGAANQRYFNPAPTANPCLLLGIHINQT